MANSSEEGLVDVGENLYLCLVADFIISASLGGLAIQGNGLPLSHHISGAPNIVVVGGGDGHLDGYFLLIFNRMVID